MKVMKSLLLLAVFLVGTLTLQQSAASSFSDVETIGYPCDGGQDPDDGSGDGQ